MRRVSSPKSTGGAGYNFADKVAAFFLVRLLQGLPPFDSAAGPLQKVHFETRADGWLLDDLLLVWIEAGSDRRCAISVKSSQQFIAGQAPSDFVTLAWEQYLGAEDEVFRRNVDQLALAVLAPPQNTHEAFRTLLDFAHSHDPALLTKRITRKGYTNAAVRKLFKSFVCPEELAAKYDVSPDDVAKLLRHVNYIDFDFASPVSSPVSDVIRILRDSIRSHDLAEAKKLWANLNMIASESRSTGGSVNLKNLTKKLRLVFQLVDHPNHSADWRILDQQTQSEIDGVIDSLGSTIHIRRTSIVEEIQDAFKRSKLVALVGDSGTGKTVAAKAWSQSSDNPSKTIWFSTGVFTDSSLESYG